MLNRNHSFQQLLVHQPLGRCLRVSLDISSHLWMFGRTSYGARLSELLVVFLPHRSQVPGRFCYSHGVGLLQLSRISYSFDLRPVCMHQQLGNILVDVLAKTISKTGIFPLKRYYMSLNALIWKFMILIYILNYMQMNDLY